ncbi:MAG: DUF3524 domain-containing protein [Pseudomonadales bacterium]
MRILLLSAYDALSHRYWREQLLAQFPSVAWSVLALPPRHFSYRVRGNPLSWYSAQRELLQQRFDLVIATSVVDVACLRGLVPSLAALPLWLYCHENQFHYPDSGQQRDTLQRGNRLQAQLVFLYNCLCADAISFNSAFNRDTALAGLGRLLQQLPDKFDPALIDGIGARSDVLPVPVESLVPKRKSNKEYAGTLPGAAASRNLQLLWNHRWEYDKGPEHLLAFVEALAASDLPITMHIAGQQFREQPAAFAVIEKLLDDPLLRGPVTKGQWGFVASQRKYRELLAGCDVVLSTAQHDFQGLAVLQACQAGCAPLLPDRLAYPEYFAPRFLYHWHDNPVDNARSMLHRLQDVLADLAAGKALPDLQGLGWNALAPAYQQKISFLGGAAIA